LLEEIDILWRTGQLRSARINPLDEVRTVMSVFDETLFPIVPEIYRNLDLSLQPDPMSPAPPLAPTFLRFGSWVGGDRDGNPAVTADVAEAAMEVHAEHVLLGYETATTRIGRALTVHAAGTAPSPALAAALAAARSEDAEQMADIEARRRPSRTASCCCTSPTGSEPRGSTRKEATAALPG
jgi:phosphoenolpyruvate carboxylase